MKSKVFKFLILFFVFHLNGKTQNILFGTIKESKKRNLIKDVKIFDSIDFVLLTKSDSLGNFELETNVDTINIYLSKPGFSTLFKSWKSALVLSFSIEGLILEVNIFSANLIE